VHNFAAIDRTSSLDLVQAMVSLALVDSEHQLVLPSLRDEMSPVARRQAPSFSANAVAVAALGAIKVGLAGYSSPSFLSLKVCLFC
jgi:hypothetical protein